MIQIAGGDWVVFRNGAWQPASEQNISPALVMNEGNTSQDLNALQEKDLVGFGYKTIDIAAGFQASVTDVPTIDEFTVEGRSVKDLVRESELPTLPTEDVHGHASKIFNIEVNRSEIGGWVDLLASLQNEDGTWTDFQDYKVYFGAKEYKAKAIRFRGRYNLTASGTIAKLNQISVEHQTGRSTLFVGDKTTCITRYFDMPCEIHKAHLNLKHTSVRDTSYDAYVSFMSDEQPEAWNKMTRDVIRVDKVDKNYVDEQFDYEATDENKWPSGKRVAIRIDIYQDSGTETNVALGVGTGASTKYFLPHHALWDSIKVSPEGAKWTYDSITDTLDVTAPAQSEISVSYDWKSKTTFLKSMACIFNE